MTDNQEFLTIQNFMDLRVNSITLDDNLMSLFTMWRRKNELGVWGLSLLFPIVVFAILLRGNISEWTNAKALSMELAQNQCRNIANQISLRMNNIFYERANDLTILADWWRYSPESSREDIFRINSQKILHREPSFLRVEYLDKKNQVLYSTDSSIEKNLEKHSKDNLSNVAKRLKENGNIYCTPPYFWDEGTIAIDMFSQVYRESETLSDYLGAMRGTIRLSELLDKITPILNPKEYVVMITVGGHQVKFNQESDPDYLPEIQGSTRFELYGNEWGVVVFLCSTSKITALFEDTNFRLLCNGMISIVISGLLCLLLFVIHAIRKKQQELRRSEYRLRELAENIQEVFWLYDVQSKKIDYVNPAYEPIFGRSKEELYRDSYDWLAAVHPDDFERMADFFSHWVQEGIFEKQCRIIHPSGEMHWIHFQGYPVMNEQGVMIRIAGVVEDITQKKSVEDALRANEKTLRQIIDLVPQMIFARNREGQILLANRAFAEAYGKHVSDITNCNFREIHLLSDEVQRFLRDDDYVFQTGQPTFIARETFTDILGSIRILQTTRIPFLLPHSEEPVVLGISLDITKREEAEREQKKLEDQLLQSQKMEAIGQLAGGIAHDFNNLLTGIIGYSNLVLRSLKKEDSNYQNIQEIHKSGERAALLTRQLLAFSRKQILEPKVLCLSDLVKSMEEMLRRMIGEDIEFHAQLDPTRSHVKADPAQVTQIIMNLVVNARDAMPNGGRLLVETKTIRSDDPSLAESLDIQPGLYVMLSVSDNGSGIDEKIQSQIFEPFFTTKGLGKGTGLGLSMVYGIVKQSGGTIQVISKVGQGTTFRIFFPWVDEFTADHLPKPIESPTLRGSETILLVEDDEVVNHMSAHALKEYGYTVIAAYDAFSAYDLVEHYNQPIHLLLTDVVLPKESGRVIADKLKSKHPEMKVLFMSGYTNEAIVHHGILEKGIAFMQKPFTVEDLIRKVRAVLDQS